MLSSISISITFSPAIIRLKHRAFFANSSLSSSSSSTTLLRQDDAKKPNSVHRDSLRVLEWDKLCDSVASFARTSLGREATRDKLWSLDQSYEESLRLLDETNAAIEIIKHGGCSLDFTGVDVSLVRSGVRHARRSLPVEANEAMAIACLLQYADALQVGLKTALKEDSDWHRRFMPLTEVILGFVVNRSLVKLIQKVIDEDGSVKDSATPNLKCSREEVRTLERRVYQVIDSLVRNEKSESSSMEVCNVNGRWCVKSNSSDRSTSFKGLLLSSGSGGGSVVEPLSVVSINDELQRARESVAKAEAEALSMLASKMQNDLDDIEMLMNSVVELDVVNSRATFGISYGGSCPRIFPPLGNEDSKVSNSKIDSKREWLVYMPKAYHPLLLQQHRQKIKQAKKDKKNASLVSAIEQARPIPVDFFVEDKTRVLVITGPNTGGKTICLKTLGLAALMAKSGLHVLASESAQLPWFDSVFADIGDEQSLTQSLSTFSGHLKQISDIQSQSTSQSLVLLDETGAGTNPVEGAALGMSLLESFADSGALLTIATTHHGELKTLKYSNDVFENACMEFDDVNLKPTYKVLWGVPGRSNAINIAERLGLPSSVVEKARELYGSASAEIDETILNMERLKQRHRELLEESRHRLSISRELYEKLLVAKRKIAEHSFDQRFRKMHMISEAASMSRSALHRKARELRSSATQPELKSSSSPKKASFVKQGFLGSKSKNFGGKAKAPKVGDMVTIVSLGKKGKVVGMDIERQEVVVQAGVFRLKLKLLDVHT